MGGAGGIVPLPMGQPAVSVPIVLTQGALVTVRVNDPMALLSNETTTSGAHLLIGVGDSAYFHTATIASQDSDGRTYQVLIPFNQTANISVASAFFQLSNALGSALPHFGPPIPIEVLSGQQPAPIVLNITGIAIAAEGAAGAPRKQ